MRKIIVGNRIPRSYFVTSGTGQSDLGVHTGSYDEALKNAGIPDFNIVNYSSILPFQARKVGVPEEYEHGAVLEAIQACCNGRNGETLTVGISTGNLMKYGKRFGGLVAEYEGRKEKEEVEYDLKKRLEEMFELRNYGDDVTLEDTGIVSIESFVPEKRFGTALVVLGFVDYIVPVLDV